VSETLPIVGHFPYLGIFLLLILGTLGCPFPEDTILMLCGFLISQGVLEPVPTFLIIYPTLLLTDTFLYSAGRRYGRKVVEHARFRRILSLQRLQNIETKFGKWGAWVIVMGRPVPGLRTQLFLVSGTLRMPIMKFLIADGVSVLTTVGTMGTMGYLGGRRVS
jgi:membrane protein DedA with SNARE-associated domain